MVDARSIVTMLRMEYLKPYSQSSYHVRELKSLTRYRFSLVQDLAQMKTSFARLCVILFPELETLVSSLHLASVYVLLAELPTAKAVSQCYLTRLKNILSGSSKGHYSDDKAVLIREAARLSIGSHSDMKALELQQTIQRLKMLEAQIEDVEAKINPIEDSIFTLCGIQRH